MASRDRVKYGERFRHLPETTRLESGYLEPGRFTPAPHQGWQRSEDCTAEISCFAKRNHDDECPVRTDPFRNDQSLRGMLI